MLGKILLWLGLVAYFVAAFTLAPRQTWIEEDTFEDLAIVLALAVAALSLFMKRRGARERTVGNTQALGDGPRYLVTYLDANGRAHTDRLPAASGRALKQSLEADRCTGVVLHDDDFTARLKDESPRTRDLNTAKQELQLASNPSPRSDRWWNGKALLTGLGGLGICAWSVWRPWSFLSLVGVAVGLVVIYGAVAARASAIYSQLRRAVTWRRHEQARGLITQLRAANRLLRLRLIDNELIVYEANALAATGEMPDALAVMERLRSSSGWDEPTFLIRLSSVYGAADDEAGRLECLERAHNLSDEGSTSHIDYALGLITCGGDPNSAEQVLESRNTATLTSAARVFVAWTRGLIALERGQHARAVELLRHTLGEVEAIYDPATWEAARLSMQSALGRSLAHLSNPEGKALLERTIPFINASGSTRERDACQRALALYDKPTAPASRS